MEATTTTGTPRPFGHGPRVPSWLVTVEMLEGWGFQVKHVSHCVGMLMATKGLSENAARHRAWMEGWTDHVEKPAAVVAAEAEAREARAVVNAAAGAELRAWFAAGRTFTSGAAALAARQTGVLAA